MANGTAEATEPPTYDQQMNVLRHDVDRLMRDKITAEAEVERLRKVEIQRVRLREQAVQSYADVASARDEIDALRAEIERLKTANQLGAQAAIEDETEIEQLRRAMDAAMAAIRDADHAGAHRLLYEALYHRKEKS
jgi:predicted  nucleic acid-binding Zn-ribbon protein